jgi:hypothetical protein
MTISVVFTPTKGDLVRAGYLGLRTRPFIFALSFGFFVILPWIAALFFGALYLAGASVNLSAIVDLLIVPILSIAFFVLLPLLLIRGARSLNGPHRYEFSTEGIRLTGPGFDNRVEWKLVTRCYGFKTGLLFASGNAPLITVPARSLSPIARTQLRQLIMASGVELAGPWKRKSAAAAKF